MCRLAELCAKHNAGIGIALAGAVMGYNVVITMPSKMSQEKQAVLECLGATIYRTPSEAAWNDPDSHISLAKQLQKEIPNSHILDQYANPDNPGAHYHGTAQEIIDDFGTDLHMLVAGVGTGGTITGVAKRLKENNPKPHNPTPKSLIIITTWKRMILLATRDRSRSSITRACLLSM